MSKKQNNTTTDEQLPAAIQQAMANAIIEWPEQREKRRLPVRLTPEKLQAASDEMAETLRAIESLEAAKKAVASDYKGKIEKNKQRLRELTETIQSKEELQDVECQWIFECRGINDTGAIEDPEYKTLQRLDTLAAVTTMKITDADRQTTLPLAGADPMDDGLDDESETTVVDGTQEEEAA